MYFIDLSIIRPYEVKSQASISLFSDGWGII